MGNKQTSAGFLIKSRGRYLICHSTQDPSYKYSELDPFWTIPKGIVEMGESFLIAAIRETKEETGIDLPLYYSINKLNNLFHRYSSKSKHYAIYFLDDTDNKLFDFPFLKMLCFLKLYIVDIKSENCIKYHYVLKNSHKILTTH